MFSTVPRVKSKKKRSRTTGARGTDHHPGGGPKGLWPTAVARMDPSQRAGSLPASFPHNYRLRRNRSAEGEAKGPPRNDQDREHAQQRTSGPGARALPSCRLWGARSMGLLVGGGSGAQPGAQLTHRIRDRGRKPDQVLTRTYSEETSMCPPRRSRPVQFAKQDASVPSRRHRPSGPAWQPRLKGVVGSSAGARNGPSAPIQAAPPLSEPWPPGPGWPQLKTRAPSVRAGRSRRFGDGPSRLPTTGRSRLPCSPPAALFPRTCTPTGETALVEEHLFPTAWVAWEDSRLAELSGGPGPGMGAGTPGPQPRPAILDDGPAPSRLRRP